MGPADYPPMAKFLGSPKGVTSLFQQRPGRILIVKSLEDSAVYVDITENLRGRYPFAFSMGGGLNSTTRSEDAAFSDTIFCMLRGNIKEFIK